MSKAVLYIAMSLDGFIARNDDDVSWLEAYNDVDYGYDSFFAGIGATITGRRTYDIGVENKWPWPYPVPSFVLSETPPEHVRSDGDIRFVSGDLSEILQQACEAANGKDVWIVGGARVAQHFLAEGLVDRVVLSVIPTMLGEGIRLFENSGEHEHMTLQDVQRFGKGLVQLTYTT